MNLADMMKKAASLQANMGAAQEKLAQMYVAGSAGGGAVKVKMSGKFVVAGIEIDPKVIVASDKEMLEDLIITALADAKMKAEAVAAEEMKSVTAGLPLPPGMKLPF